MLKERKTLENTQIQHNTIVHFEQKRNKDKRKLKQSEDSKPAL